VTRLAALALLLPALAFGQVFGGAIAGGGGSRTSSGGTAPAQPTLVGMGDSIMQGAGGGSPLVSMKAVLGSRWYVVNQGVSGETAEQIRTRWLASEATYCDGARCAYVYLEGAVNSLKRCGGISAASALADMLTVVDDALAKGYIVIWQDVLPFRGWVDAGCPVTDAMIDKALSFNQGMASACAARALNTRLRCFFAYGTYVDTTRLRADGVTPAGYLKPVYSGDELHLSAAGATLLGQLAAAKVTP
jgi:lysophospholipase L1-like esterase